MVAMESNRVANKAFRKPAMANNEAVSAVITIMVIGWAHPITMIVITALTASLFAIAGFLNALFATRFDSIATIPNFVLTPLIYLGGVFYSIELLPPFWQQMSLFNPILYIVNAFRYSMLGVADVTAVTSATPNMLYRKALTIYKMGLNSDICCQNGGNSSIE